MNVTWSWYQPFWAKPCPCQGLSRTTAGVMVSPQPHTRARRPPAWEYSDIKCREEISYLHLNISLCVLENLWYFRIKKVVIALVWYSTQMLPPMTTLRSAADCYGCTQDWHIRVSFQVLEVRDMTSSACTDHYILSLHIHTTETSERWVCGVNWRWLLSKGMKIITFECFRETRASSMSF